MSDGTTVFFQVFAEGFDRWMLYRGSDDVIAVFCISFDQAADGKVICLRSAGCKYNVIRPGMNE